MKTYEDTVLIKLRRDYSKDEVVMFALNKIKELQIENGKNKSYIDELEAEIQTEKHQKTLKNGGQQWFEKYKKIKERFDKLEENIRNENPYLEIKKGNLTLNNQNKQLRKANNDLICKILILEKNAIQNKEQ